jgi:hypothetical protein
MQSRAQGETILSFPPILGVTRSIAHTMTSYYGDFKFGQQYTQALAEGIPVEDDNVEAPSFDAGADAGADDVPPGLGLPSDSSGGGGDRAPKHGH